MRFALASLLALSSVTTSVSAINVSNTTTVKASSTSTAFSSASATVAPYWLEAVKHQGHSAFNPNSTYQVFRNVKDFGAKGDGLTDDTVAIHNAMSAGFRCAPGSCQGSTITPAVVYFPSGTYLISSSIIDYYYTQIIGNPNNLPVLKPTANFNGFGLIDGDQYGAQGLGFGATNVFYRQIRNIVFDLTGVDPSNGMTALHWPTSQATSLQNCVFKMSDAPGTQHQGIFIEGGSGGFMTDLIFYGGLKSVVFGNQQFTVRNLTMFNAVVAVYQLWDWGWTYQGLSVNNCSIGIDIANGGSSGQAVGSVTVVDSTFTNTGVAISTAHDSTSQPATAGSVILEQITLTNTPVAIQGPTGIVLPGGTTTIFGWGEGHKYSPYGPVNFESSFTPFSRPSSLTKSGKYYTRSKPQYQSSPATAFVSARSAGAKGDGISDDTAVLNNLLASAAGKSIVFIDAGTYKVTSTLLIPAGSKIVGEAYSVFMGAGSFFSNGSAPRPVVSVGGSGQNGIVEWSDMIVSTQGSTAGAILIQWNLASSNSAPSGMWDVHTRIGGFQGSNLQVPQCPKTPGTPFINTNCTAAFMSMYIAPSASGLYMENTWFWTADHDIEDPVNEQITVYTGRGLYCASTKGSIWMIGTSVEHHDLYQYQFANTKNIYAGQIQTETAYWQPNPKAGVVTQAVSGWNDPDFPITCALRNGTFAECAMGWGLRIVNSQSILIYGAGLYSFFNDYNVSCSNAVTPPGGNGASCQTSIFSIEGKSSKNVNVYNLNTIGSTYMATKDGASLAAYVDNVSSYQDTIAFFQV